MERFRSDHFLGVCRQSSFDFRWRRRLRRERGPPRPVRPLGLQVRRLPLLGHTPAFLFAYGGNPGGNRQTAQTQWQARLDGEGRLKGKCEDKVEGGMNESNG